jgi:serum/glucocorticoid-regulated kinase 2
LNRNLAPEVLKGQGHGIAVDWWSLGTLIYEMLTGLPPFYSQNINIMYQKILNGELRFPSYVSSEAQSLLEGLLTRDVDKRLGSTASGGSSNIKKHPFFKDIDWDKLERKEIDPPFKPKVKNSTEISQIDTIFTGEKPTDSLVEHSLSDTIARENNFDGFTFVGSNAMDSN